MDWSCCFWRSSSEIALKAPWAPLMGVVGADFFLCREWSSSIVLAFTGVPLSSWHTSFAFLLWSCVWILGSPFRPVLLGVLLAKLNSPLSGALLSIFFFFYMRSAKSHSFKILYYNWILNTPCRWNKKFRAEKLTDQDKNEKENIEMLKISWQG